MNTYQVSFSLNGVTQISIESSDVIENTLQAEAIAIGGIKQWFQEQVLPVPDFVRNVYYIGAEEYQWDILPLK